MPNIFSQLFEDQKKNPPSTGGLAATFPQASQEIYGEGSRADMLAFGGLGMLFWSCITPWLRHKALMLL